MIVDESMLRAYVDGELDAITRQHVETVIAHSAELQSQLAALRASCLPYRAAFESQRLPEVPARLVQSVQAMADVAAAPSSNVVPLATISTTRRRSMLGLGLAAAASFAAGLFVPWRPGLEASGSDSQHARANEPWVSAIANYHALYVRETVDAPADAPSRLNRLMEGFGDRERRALVVPDLEPAGLRFKRVQRLGFGERPLIQMVYLPERGRPAALCMLPTTLPDTAPKLSKLEGLDVTSWSRQGLAYVLVTDLGPEPTMALTRGLIEGHYAPARG
jgi:anti-sigma factor RsiW